MSLIVMMSGMLLLGAASESAYDGPLELRAGHGGEVPLENANYTCKAYPVRVRGAHPPFQVATVPWPYDPANLALEQINVLANFTENTSTLKLDDFPLPEGTHFAFRVVDSVGSVEYSEERWVGTANKDSHYCRDVNAPKELSRGQVAGIVVGSIAGAILLASFLCCCIKRRRQRSARADLEKGSG